MPWEFNSPSFRLHVPLAERHRLQPSKLADHRFAAVPGSTLAGHFLLIGDRLTVGRLSLKQVMKVQVILPELRSRWPCPRNA